MGDSRRPSRVMRMLFAQGRRIPPVASSIVHRRRPGARSQFPILVESIYQPGVPIELESGLGAILLERSFQSYSAQP